MKKKYRPVVLHLNPLTPTVAIWLQLYKASCVSPERQSARMSKIINDSLTGSDTGCFVAVPIWQQYRRQRVKTTAQRKHLLYTVNKRHFMHKLNTVVLETEQVA